MADALTVRLITPREPLLTTTADEIRAPGARGSFGVRPGHTPFLTTLDAGALVIVKDGREDAYAVIDGFVEVTKDEVVVLAEEAVHMGRIDLAEEERIIAEARRRMAGESPESKRYRQEAATIRRSAARALVARGGGR